MKRTGLPGLLYGINEEELLYQVSSRSRMKKNCLTKPGGILLDHKYPEMKNWFTKLSVKQK